MTKHKTPTHIESKNKQENHRLMPESNAMRSTAGWGVGVGGGGANDSTGERSSR